MRWKPSPVNPVLRLWPASLALAPPQKKRSLLQNMGGKLPAAD